MDKVRLDVLLVEKGLAASREKAKTMIMAGMVLVDERPADKAGSLYAETAKIRIKGEVCPFVSRGGHKLEKAIHVFQLDLAGKTCADIGASTGGFTDCMLQHGAEKVYAIDVGYGQLDWKIRNDPRVVVMERTNARYLTDKDLAGVDFVSVDVSFISLKLIFPAIMQITADDAAVVTLIKPQFEAGKEHVGKKGVVKDPDVHFNVIRSVLDQAAELGLYACGLDYSPIKGPNGNIEYIASYQKKHKIELKNEFLKEKVYMAHKNL